MASDLPQMSYSELLPHNGVDKPTVYLALKNIVFDVSSADFYKPGGPYHVLAGHDASVALAIMTKEPEFVDHNKYNWEECLDENEKIVLDSWFSKISEKYAKVAQIKKV